MARLAVVAGLLPALPIGGLLVFMSTQPSTDAIEAWAAAHAIEIGVAIVVVIVVAIVPALLAPLLLRCPSCNANLGRLGIRPRFLASARPRIKFCPCCGSSLHL